MTTVKQEEYGIKYNVIKLNNNMCVLVPTGLIKGYSVRDKFYSTDIHKTLFDLESLSEPEIIDSIVNIESLKEIYEYDDEEFIKEYYLSEEKDYIILVEIKDNKLIKRKINIQKLVKKESQETYERQKGEPTVTLNCDALEELLNSDDIQNIKEKLEKFKKLINTFREKEKKDGITSVTVNNGHITEIGTNRKIITPQLVATEQSLSKQEQPRDVNDFTVRGLEQYIKERVFGHDKEIKEIATRLIMNYRSTPEYGTESILIAGPTGTGKTETIRAASEYLNLPFIQVNTANLVPQGIKGPTLEDYLYALIIASQNSVEKAERGLIFLDEFDKIGKDSLDIKETVKQVFLKFIEGDTFLIEKPANDCNFNTRMLNKTFAGAFQELFDSKKSIGFGSSKEENLFNPSKITSGNYFGKELVTRIEHIFAYEPLSKEMQRRVLLESKLSKLTLKKKRYEEEFHVELVLLDEYIDAILEQLRTEEKSMRDLNNLVLKTLSEVEYELLENEGKVKRLVLSAKTVDDPKDFDLH